MDAKSIDFSTGGVSFHLSPSDIDRLMGFQEMQNILVERTARLILEVPNPQAFWGELFQDRSKFYYSRKYSSDFIKNFHKLLQYTIAHSIGGRSHSNSKINHMDFLCLYGIIKKVPVSLGFVIANLFMSHHNENVIEIYIRPYNTAIVKGN